MRKVCSQQQIKSAAPLCVALEFAFAARMYKAANNEQFCEVCLCFGEVEFLENFAKSQRLHSSQTRVLGADASWLFRLDGVDVHRQKILFCRRDNVFLVFALLAPDALRVGDREQFYLLGQREKSWPAATDELLNAVGQVVPALAREIEGPEFEHDALPGLVLDPERFDQPVIREYFRRIRILFSDFSYEHGGTVSEGK